MCQIANVIAFWVIVTVISNLIWKPLEMNGFEVRSDQLFIHFLGVFSLWEAMFIKEQERERGKQMYFLCKLCLNMKFHIMQVLTHMRPHEEDLIKNFLCSLSFSMKLPIPWAYSTLAVIHSELNCNSTSKF